MCVAVSGSLLQCVAVPLRACVRDKETRQARERERETERERERERVRSSS